jgi:hypothetical protein
VYLAAPFHADDAEQPVPARLLSNEQFEQAVRTWEGKIADVTFELPASAAAYGDTFHSARRTCCVPRRSCVAAGAAALCTLVDSHGAVMAAAHCCVPIAPARHSTSCALYARFQAPDGNVPCAVDAQAGRTGLPSTTATAS